MEEDARAPDVEAEPEAAVRTTGRPPASVSARVLSRLVPGSRHAPWISVFALWILAASVSPVAAAIGLDGTSSNTATSTSSITISHATGNGANRLMLVGVSLFDGGHNLQVNSVTYGGQNLTFVGGRRDSSDSVRCEIWRLTSPPSGTANVVVTLNGSSDGIAAGVVTFNGVDQITPLGSFNSAQGMSPTPSVTVSSGSGQLVFDTVAFKDGLSLNVGANQTQRWSGADGNNKLRGAGSTEPGAASVTMSWSEPGTNSKEWAIGAVPIRPASFLPDGMIKISTEAD